MSEQRSTTKDAWHRLAEHVVSAELHRSIGKIGLRVTPGGFGTPEFFVDGVRRSVRVDGDQLVVGAGDVDTRFPIRTLESAGEALGGPVGAPRSVFEPTSSEGPEPLVVDESSAAELAGWFRLVDDALAEFRRRHHEESPTITQLWPEHFDVAISMSEVNYGGSPGDSEHDEPYLYVGPWEPREGPFWNESFGASISWREVPTVDAAVTFFESGHHAVHAA